MEARPHRNYGYRRVKWPLRTSIVRRSRMERQRGKKQRNAQREGLDGCFSKKLRGKSLCKPGCTAAFGVVLEEMSYSTAVPSPPSFPIPSDIGLQLRQRKDLILKDI